MTVMYKATIVWGGFPGAPGYTNLYATTTDPLQAGLDTFITGIATYRTVFKNLFNNVTTIDILPEVELVEDTDGELVNIMTATTPPTSTVGAQNGGITGVSGLCVTWLTAGAVFGRRRQGRTFMVPVAVNAIEANGTIDTPTLTAQRAAATAYATATAFHPVVWVRPKHEDPHDSDSPLIHAGQAVPMVGSRISDKAAVLRSRRD
jgi:hypothetical protein